MILFREMQRSTSKQNHMKVIDYKTKGTYENHIKYIYWISAR